MRREAVLWRWIVLVAACAGCSSSGEAGDTGGASAGSGGSSTEGGSTTGTEGGSTTGTEGGSTTGTEGGSTTGTEGGSTTGTEGGSSGTPIESPADFYSETIATLCGLLHECCTIVQRLQIPYAGVNPAACEALLSEGSSLVEAEVAAGRATYDPVKAGECVAASALLTCADVLKRDRTVPACEGALAPAVALGDHCEQPFECIDSWCDSASGVCVALLALGEDCAAHNNCESKYCDDAMKCAEQPADGTLCH